MATFLTALYIAFSHASPESMFPGIGPYRPLLCLFAVACIAVLCVVARYGYPYLAPQNILMVSLFALMLFSSAVELGFSGMLSTFSTFLPSFVGFVFCIASIRRIPHFRLIVSGLILVAFYQAISGIVAFHARQISPFVYVWPPLDEQVPGGAVIRRIRGLGFLSDPNDFAQFLLVVLPLLWTAWRKGAAIRNSLLVIAPSLVILWAVVLTQSRGGLLAFAVVFLFAFRKRFGNLGSLVVIVILLGGLIGSGLWKRDDVSVHNDSAAGRVEAWGNGIAMWKTSPLWGVGFGQFSELNIDENGLTAHNSYVLCFAELGTIGYLLWLGVIAASILDLNSILKRLTPDDDFSAALLRWTTAIRLSIIAYLAAGWFLSRTYYMTLYVLFGMTVALVRMANRETECEVHTQARRILGWSSGAAAASVVLIYCTLWSRAV